MRWLLVVACACARPAESREPLRNVAAASTRFVAIERVPALAIEMPAEAVIDCRPSQITRRRFAGEQVIACGPVARDADGAAIAAARDCVERALADDQPFLVEAELTGIDSTVARGFVAVMEDAGLVGYQVYFDSDPCGGSCPLRGTTTIDRCARIVRDVTNPDACAVDVTRCFRCDGERRVVTCRFGA